MRPARSQNGKNHHPERLNFDTNLLVIVASDLNEFHACPVLMHLHVVRLGNAAPCGSVQGALQ